MTLLALETSCDETAAALVDDAGTIVRQELYSHGDIHVALGGIVPELQARAHLPRLAKIVERLLGESRVEPAEIDAYAATTGPGLVGSLICGAVFAKTLAWRFDKPFFGVNHLEGHALSPMLDNPGLAAPYLTILISGGHTASILVIEPGRYLELGTTRDDALGEAFDKVGAMLSLDYPQGPKLEVLARSGRPGRYDLPAPMWGSDSLDFSFSGLKSAVRRIIESADFPAGGSAERKQAEADLARAFSDAAGKALADRTRKALDKCSEPETAKKYGAVRAVCPAGGVAANLEMRKATEGVAKEYGLPFFAPSTGLCTDNAKMIAFAAWHRMKRRDVGDDPALGVEPNRKLESSRPSPR